MRQGPQGLSGTEVPATLKDRPNRLELEQLLGVAVEDFPSHLLVPGQAAHFDEGLGALASGAAAEGIVAIGSKHELILMTFEEGPGMFGIAGEEVQSGAGRQITMHVRELGQEPVGDAAGCHFALGIHHFRVVVFVDVSPPGLGMTDETDIGIFLQDLGKVSQSDVIGAVLEVKEDGHLVFLGDLGVLIRVEPGPFERTPGGR